ncbi:hypothetical protein [Streptomyces sp. 135]|uniref:hypothetical protein n=1 Tax=Streptomyces sp. 135 TaxID=2838850 RepID=UPI001CBE3DF5|nr:hypothetical protein [Streptomyces sp. 135]
MNRPIRLVTAALTVSAALLLAACGSGGGEASDKIEGADSNGGGKASASAPTSTKPSGAKRPKIKLPGSFRADFVGWHHSDPKKQAILDDGKERLRAEYAAIIEGNPQAKPVAFYTSQQALTSSRAYIQGYVGNNHTLVGEARVFNPQVSLSDAGGGVLFYCVDESKGYTEDRGTKKRTGTPDDVNPVLQYRTTLKETKQGVWSTVSLETERGGCDK